MSGAGAKTVKLLVADDNPLVRTSSPPTLKNLADIWVQENEIGIHGECHRCAGHPTILSYSACGPIQNQ